MYVGILFFLTGWMCLAGSPLLVAYTLTMAIAFHLRVVLYEELAKQFGEQWHDYALRVPRWSYLIRR